MKKIKMTKQTLNKLTTSRLLKYKNSLLECPDDVNWDGCQRLSKASDYWHQHYALVKSILATREHVERKI